MTDPSFSVPGDVLSRPAVAPDLLKTDEAAKLLRCSVRTIYRMLHRGELQGFRVGAEIRIPVAALAELRKRRFAR